MAVELPHGGEDPAVFWQNLRAHPAVDRLLGDRSSLPELRPTSRFRSFTPLLITTGMAAMILFARSEGPDQTQWVASGAFLLFGLLASLASWRRRQRLADAPVEAVLARVAKPSADHGAPNGHWVLALEGGRQRLVLPLNDTGLTPGAGGVAWVRGKHLLRFERLD